MYEFWCVLCTDQDSAVWLHSLQGSLQHQVIFELSGMSVNAGVQFLCMKMKPKKPTGI